MAHVTVRLDDQPPVVCRHLLIFVQPAQKSCNMDGPFQEGFSMLVLSRKKNESIIINDNITVTIVEIRGDKVRLGIDAPKEVSVHRREIYEAIRSQAQRPGASAGSHE